MRYDQIAWLASSLLLLAFARLLLDDSWNLPMLPTERSILRALRAGVIIGAFILVLWGTRVFAADCDVSHPCLNSPPFVVTVPCGWRNLAGWLELTGEITGLIVVVAAPTAWQGPAAWRPAFSAVSGLAAVASAFFFGSGKLIGLQLQPLCH